MSELRMRIDGRDVTATDGMTLLEAAERAGIAIPKLCHHEKLEPFGGCRLCMVEVESKGWTRLVVSCVYLAEDNLVVRTRSEKLSRIRKTLLELLLARCPKAKLIQDLAADHGVFESRFKTDDPEELCVLCGLCVRACRDVVGVSAISMANRSPAKLVTTPFLDKSPACIGCGSCAFICPTNVIPYTEKDGVRTIWGRNFELQACSKCGNYIEPKAQLEHWAKITGDPVESFYTCRDCR